jgi:hypothetical protein
MRPTIKRLLVIGLITTTGLLASAETTHAAPTLRFTGHVGSRSLVASSKVINSFIVPTTKSAKYSPTKLTVPDVAGANCTETNYSFLITNVTSVTQQPSYAGSPFLGAIPSGSVEWLCSTSGGNGGSFTINLAVNAKAKLTVTLLP